MNTITKHLLTLSAVWVGGISSALADPFAFTDGDLILGVQAASGTGSTKNVFFNLGPGTALRDNASQGFKGNIGATLTTVFGASWYSRSDVYFGVIANLKGNPNTGIGSAGAVNGDPSRTFYVSTAADSAGQGTLYAATTFPPASLGSAATNFSGMETMVVLLTAEADGSAILDQGTRPVEWNNGWKFWNPTPGAAFTNFTGGIQNNFGKVTPSTYVDIQRVLSTNTGAIPTGVVGGGTYEATIAISNAGAVTMLSSTPPSAYLTWIGGFTTIIAPANQLETADPDGDGATNLEEFAFGGNPENSADQGGGQVLTADANADTLKDITLTLEVRSAATFSASGNDLVSGLTDELTYRVEGSTDLVNWDSAVSEVIPQIGSGSPSSGYVLKTFRLNGGNGLVGKGFLRASVVK
ncbi:MAG: hypothetical protein RLZZ214_2169 [Verrucomicrobiota bacterium]